MASITKRNGKWHVRVRKGDLPTKCNSFSYKEDAIRWARETERALENGSYSRNDFSVFELLERYLTEITPKKKCAKVEHYRIRKLQKRSIAKKLVGSLRPEDIANYRDERLKEVAPSTCIWDLSILSHAISIAQKEWGLSLKANPVHLMRKPVREKGRERRLSYEEWPAPFGVMHLESKIGH